VSTTSPPTSSAAAAAPAPARARRVVVPLLAAAVLALGAALAYVLLVQRPDAAAARAPTPVFLPLETLVVNLDGGDGSDAFAGEHMAQVGITLEVADERAARRIKPYLPGIRNSVLMLVSQRSARELLALEGKERLAADMLQAVQRFLGGHFDDNGTSAVRRVLFSSLIIQ